MSEMDSLKLLQLEMLANAVINSPSEVNQSTTPTQSNYGSEKHSPSNLDIMNDEGFSADENKIVSNNVNCNGEDHEVEPAFMYEPQQENISSRSLFESPRNLFCQNELVIVENVKTEPPDLGFSDDETGEQGKIESIENDITNTISQLVDNINDDQLETNETAYEESVRSRQYVNNVENGNVYYELSDLLTNDEKLRQNCFVKLVDCKGILNLDKLNLIPLCVEKKRKLMDKATLESSDKVKQFKLSNDFNTVQNELDNRSVIQTKLNVSCGEKLSTVVPSFISTISTMTSSSHLLSNKKVKKFSSEKSDLNPLKNSNKVITSLSTSSTVSSSIGFVVSSPLSTASTTSTTKTSLVTSTLHSTPFKSRSNIFSILTPAKEIEDSSYATNCMENMTVSSTSLLTSKSFSFSGWSSLRTTLQMSSAKCNKKKYQPVVRLKNLTDFDVSKICQQLKNSPNIYTDRNDSKPLSTSSSFSEELKTSIIFSAIVSTTSNVDNFDKNSHLSKKTDTSNKPKINPPSQTPQSKHPEVESTKKQDKKMRPSLDKKSKYSSISSSKSNRREVNEKKTKEEEVLKKLQDTIRIKPVKQQSSNQVKRIPKINQMLTEEDKARSVLAKIDTAEPLEFNSKYQPAIRGRVQSYGQANNYQNTGYRDRFNFYKNGGDGDRSSGWRRNYDKSRDDDGNKLNKRLNDLSAMNRQYINNNRFNSRDNSTSSNKPQPYNWFDDLPYGDGCDDDGDRDDVDNNKNSSTKSTVSDNKKSQRYNWFNDLSTDAGCDDGEADYDNADKNNNKSSNAVRSNNNRMPIESDDSTKVNTIDNNKPQRYNWFSNLPFDAGFDDGKAGYGSINKNDSRSGSYGNNNKIVTANNSNNNKINALKNEKDDKVNSVDDNNSSRPQRYNWSSDASFDIGFNDDRAEYGAGNKDNSMLMKNNKTGSISSNINNKANAINNNINNYVNPVNNNNKQQRYYRLNNLSSGVECNEDKVDYSTFNKNSSPFSNNSKMSGINNKVDTVHNNINSHPLKNNEIDLDKSLKRKFLDAFKEILKKDDSLNFHTRRQVSDICLHIQEQIRCALMFDLYFTFL
ncbi:hypothetical protein HELRODRAFT_165768 [Helobdella robusta]|uniref:Uncharacterized protein n=1 Tax=Helobdella robusta TaxID=6412 RepID=T1EX97_HELRO|nr:hypothetical protein HELRODRAFT_165768 [Helobdella robusta]ESN91707.1 hypothetical protein HELRODRAFT_165768 [Helobdella robusta]